MQITVKSCDHSFAHLVLRRNELYIGAHDPKAFQTRLPAILFMILEAVHSSPYPLPDVEFVVAADDFPCNRVGAWNIIGRCEAS